MAPVTTKSAEFSPREGLTLVLQRAFVGLDEEQRINDGNGRDAHQCLRHEVEGPRGDWSAGECRADRRWAESGSLSQVGCCETTSRKFLTQAPGVNHNAHRRNTRGTRPV